MEPLQPTDPGRVGPYQLASRLGAGGMGRVYLGHSRAGMAVAVKVVHAHLATDAVFRSRFRREITAARAVSGAFTAPLLDADPDALAPWLATAYVPGISLHEAVANHGPMPPASVRILGAALVEALASIHAAGVVHRDLKPSNVLLGPDGPRVIDFGIAHPAGATGLTRTGHGVGSPGFMAPEQARGQPGGTGTATDVFSFGAVLTYAATGTGPFGTAVAPVLVYRVVHEPPRLDAVTDPDLRRLVERCLAKDPDGRPTTAQLLRYLSGAAPGGAGWLPAPIAADIADVTRRIATIPAGPPPAAPAAASGWARHPARRRPSRRTLVVAGAAATTAAAAGVAVLVSSWGEGPDTTPGTTGPAPTTSTATARARPVVREGSLRWRFDTGNLIYSSPVVADGTLYVGSEAGFLFALDAANGAQRWRYQAGARITSRPAVVGNLVYASSQDGYLYAVGTASGTRRWRHRLGTPSSIAADVVAAGGTVYAAGFKGDVFRGFEGGQLFALDPATGTVRWQRDTTTPVTSGVAAADGAVYLPDDALYALDAATGTQRWAYPLPDPAAPTAGGGSIYCASFDDGTVHAVDPATGQARWMVGTGRRVSAAPTLDAASGLLLVPDFDGNLTALDAADGTLAWRFGTGGQLQGNAAVEGGTVFLGSADGKFYAVDAATGFAVWAFVGGDEFESSPTVAAGTVYAGNFDGYVYALDAAGGPSPAPTGTTTATTGG